MHDALRQPLALLGLRKPAAGRLCLACITNTGGHRDHNEDNFVFFGTVLPQEHQSMEAPLKESVLLDALTVVAVFDGMGGELMGDAASFAAASRLNELVPSLDASESDLLRAFREMQDAVCDLRADWRLSSTGTTVVVLCCRNGVAFVGNLGDSKAFLVRDGELVTLSVSHTDEWLLGQLGLDRKPALTQYLGVDETDAPMEPHVVGFELELGDRILLASDGLTDMVDESSIARTTSDAASMEELVCDLCDQALVHGGEDNVTVIACEVLAG